jgi:hypothetical protein
MSNDVFNTVAVNMPYFEAHIVCRDGHGFYRSFDASGDLVSGPRFQQC